MSNHIFIESMVTLAAILAADGLVVLVLWLVGRKYRSVKK